MGPVICYIRYIRYAAVVNSDGATDGDVTHSMVKSARGLSQKRAKTTKTGRALEDRERTLAARKHAKQQGLTPHDERRINAEASASAAERKAIKKAKRERRKDAKGAAKAAKQAAADGASEQRAMAAADRERQQRQAAAAAARAARDAAAL